MSWTQLEVVKGLAIYGGDELNLMAKGGNGGAWVAARLRSGKGGGEVMVFEVLEMLDRWRELVYFDYASYVAQWVE
uniref:Uncharacterized protein n=1 Tax=Tanacetum cinerariifolium TaxID=118510 RepID=A0A6L2KWH3_TANCI|nr:hypothetical protein [Tanacetum cinerariifolium]